MKKAGRIVGCILIVLAVFVAAIWFIPRPAGLWYKQTLSEGYTGAFASNSALDGVQFLDLGGYSHPETVLVRDGWVYVSVKEGVLLRMREDGSELTKLLDTGGCLLGFDFDQNGDLIVADCDYHGTGAVLCVKNDGSGDHTVLLSKETGTELFYPNGLPSRVTAQSTSRTPRARFRPPSTAAAPRRRRPTRA